MKLIFKIQSLPFFILFPLLLQAQTPVKFGKISKEEIEFQETPLDPEADAVILCDYGEIEISSNLLTFYQHRRFKILNKNGEDWANISLPFYFKDGTEKIIQIKAHTINYDANGKEQKTKVDKKNIFTVDINEYWKEKRFTFPNVQEGSILEFEMLKSSENVVSLEDWVFQNEIPTLKSALKVRIDEFLNYQLVYNGKRLTALYGDKISDYWELQNLPPLRDEPYCPNPLDYAESIRFQLAGYYSYTDLGTRQYNELMTTWEKMANELLQHDNYRKILNANQAAKSLLPKIVNEEDSPLEKIQKIYDFVQKNTAWNHQYRRFPEQSFQKILDTKSGSSVEINLLLVKLLKTAEIDANPLIISTKGNGLITKVYPLYTQFNQVIAHVYLDGKQILMDATDPYCPYDMLPLANLNPLGYLLHKKASRWVKIPLPKKTKSIVVTNVFFEENKINYKIEFSFFEHHAAFYRKSYEQEEGKNSFVTEYLLQVTEDSEVQLDSFHVDRIDNIKKPLSVVCYLSKELENGLEEDIIYLEPLLMKHFEKNPFNNPLRYLPVDFVLPFTEKFIFNMNIPEGYELAETPENVRLTTNSQQAFYNFLFQSKAPIIQLSSEFKIKDPLIHPQNYPPLREMFNQMIGKQSEVLVLKKIQ